MPFIVGIAIGFGVGFAGALLMAPEKKKRELWPPHMPRAGASQANGNSHSNGRLAGLMESVKERVNEAAQEAREAKRQKEREMLERYEQKVGRKAK
jgi:hypothetical protein